MGNATDTTGPATAEVVDFDEAVLAGCPADLRDELQAEADMLAEALPTDGRARQIRALATGLSTRHDDSAPGRLRVRQLAAALRRLARRIEPDDAQEPAASDGP